MVFTSKMHAGGWFGRESNSLSCAVAKHLDMLFCIDHSIYATAQSMRIGSG
ncbi:MAG: hypothetical protein GZ092_03810 [Polaromonas sp.]|nr:hypothetical protein [Polaromonas sp.]